MFNRRVLFALLAGIVLGVTGAVLAPPLVSPHLPRSITAGSDQVVGEVVAKSKEVDRLLVTVSGERGAVLVTVTKRIKEIDLLVEVGDSVTLVMSAYKPFVKDPAIAGVRKAARAAQETEVMERAATPGAPTKDTAPEEVAEPTPSDTIEHLLEEPPVQQSDTLGR